MMRASMGVLAVVVVLAGSAFASVTVVDPGGGAGAPVLQAALDAAAGGDILLVRPGDYSLPEGARFTVSGKGLVLAADGGTVTLPGLSVSGVPAGKTVVLRGLRLGPVAGIGDETPSLQVTGGPGRVWTEDCTVIGRDGGIVVSFFVADFPASPAARVDGGTLVAQRSSFTGGRGHDHAKPFATDLWPGDGMPGLAVGGGSAALHGCTLVGGAGGNGPNDPFDVQQPDGGPALLASDGAFLHVAGSSLTGGSNGDNTTTALDEAGDGLEIADAACEAWLRDSTFAPGAVQGAQGVAGLPVDAPAGTTETLPAPTGAVAMESPLREGQAGALSLAGPPGDVALLLVSLSTDFLPMPGRQGVLEAGQALYFSVFPVGVLPAGGSLELLVTMPQLPGALDGLWLPLQLVLTGAGGTTVEGTSVLVWVDDTL